ncbi:MAG: hypothetical protein AAFY12_17065 [Pseudomonadota bacterium]
MRHQIRIPIIVLSAALAGCSGGGSVDVDQLAGNWSCEVFDTFDGVEHASAFDEVFNADGTYTSEGMINMYRPDADIALMYEANGRWSLQGDTLRLDARDGLIDAISVGAETERLEARYEEQMNEVYGAGLSERRTIKSLSADRLVMTRDVDGSDVTCARG